MNIERFKLPAIIAASLHGAFFLSSPDTTARNLTPPQSTGDVRTIPDDFVIEVPLEPEDRAGGEAGGGPNALPDIPDLPPVLVDPARCTVPVTPYSPAINPVETLRDYTGLPGGPDIGPGTPGNMKVPDIGSLDHVPRAMVQPAPEYPAGLRHDGISGSVTVAFIVDTSGRVVSAEAVKWTHRAFVEPAVRAVLRWRFEPGTLNGRKVRFRVAVPMEFKAET